jgi:hypothetical protein
MSDTDASETVTTLHLLIPRMSRRSMLFSE